MGNNQIIIVLFGILYFAFIIYTRRKGDFEEYSVANRGLGSFVIFASICASYLGPGWTLGLTRNGFNNGMFMAFIAPIMGIAIILFALFLAPKIRRKFTNSYSIGDIVGGPAFPQSSCGYHHGRNNGAIITLSIGGGYELCRRGIDQQCFRFFKILVHIHHYHYSHVVFLIWRYTSDHPNRCYSISSFCNPYSDFSHTHSYER